MLSLYSLSGLLIFKYLFYNFNTTAWKTRYLSQIKSPTFQRKEVLISFNIIFKTLYCEMLRTLMDPVMLTADTNLENCLVCVLIAQKKTINGWNSMNYKTIKGPLYISCPLS